MGPRHRRTLKGIFEDPVRVSSAAPSEGNRQRGRQIHAAVPDRGGGYTMMEYKSYIGKVEFDAEAGIFHGEVINTRDVITFQGQSVTELTEAFRESVDDYLEFCKLRGETPEKPFSGQFVTRIPRDLHRKIHVAAVNSGKSLNAWVTEQLQNAVHQVVVTSAGGQKTASKAKVVKKVAKRKTSKRKKAIEQHA